MKLGKITKSRRRYHDACGTAHALDLIGERWAILVIRELMFGPRRFSDLREALPGLSANVLTQRLQGLEEAGVVVRRRLPPPAGVQVYGLSEWGLEAEPVIAALGRWGASSPTQDVTLPLSPVGLALSFKTMFVPERAGSMRFTLGVRTPRDRFVLCVADGRMRIARDERSAVEAELAGDAGAIAGYVYGLLPGNAEDEGALTITGDRSVVERFRGLVHLPAKALGQEVRASFPSSPESAHF